MKNKIIITILSFFAVATITAQEVNSSYTGRIVDKRGNPVSGAMISIDGNKEHKTASDRNGYFTIETDNNDLLIIETAEMARKKVKVDTLKNNESIVITDRDRIADIGFGLKPTMEEFAGSISRTDFDKLDNRSALNLTNALYGNTLGLTALQNGGTVWENQSALSIRGLKTLSNNGIVILVDGIERPIDELTVEEVESVTVLKDAAALALYGYRGANGILSVRTKRGKYGMREIKISYDHAFNSPVRLPKFANSANYAKALNEALLNDGKTPRYTADEINAFADQSHPFIYPNVDWVNETLRDNGVSNIFNVSLRGGGMSSKYYVMLNLQDNRGFINEQKNNNYYSSQLKYSKANIRANMDIDLFSSTQMQFNLLGILNEHNRPGRHHSAIMGDIYTLPSAAYPIQTYDGIWGGNVTWPYANPVAGALGTGHSRGHSRSLYADMKLIQDLSALSQGLKASMRLAYDNKAEYWDNLNKSYKYASDAATLANNMVTDTIRTTAGENKDEASSSMGPQMRSFNFIADVTYEKSFAQHYLSTALIYGYNSYVGDKQNNTFYRQSLSAYMHYMFDKKYIVEGVLNLSGSNRFAPKHKYSLSPTISAGWIVSNENFMKDVGFINFLKLRASTGLLHSDNVPVTDYWQQYFYGAGEYSFDNSFSWGSGFAEGRLPSKNIKSEKAFKNNFGIDASFFKNITFTGDVYYERRSNIAVPSGGSISSVIGIDNSFVSAGIVDSYGFELGLDFLKTFNDITINAGGKFTLSKNKIIEQLEEPRAYSYLERTGKSVNQIFGLQAVGFFVDEDDIKNSPTQQFSNVKPGDIKYKDQNEDNIINSFDEVAIGYNNVIPEAYYSFDFGAEWKGIGFNATLQGVGNYSVILNTKSVYRPLIDNTTISDHYFENRWTPENPFAKYPRLTTESNDNNLRNSTVWLADASYIKLRNIELYYRLPKNILANLKMNSARLYIRGVDLLCFDHINISDPESTGAAYPITKSVNIGFAVTF